MVDINLIVVVGILALLIIGFLGYGFISNRLKIKRLKKEKADLKQLANKTLAIFLARILIIIQKNDDLVSNFVVGSNKMKMSDINNLAKIHLQKIQQDPVITNILKSGYESEQLFFENLEFLAKSKSNLWKKRNISQLDYFSSFADYIKDFDLAILGLFNEEKVRFLKYYRPIIQDLKQGIITIEQVFEKSEDYFQANRIPITTPALPFWKKWKKN
ncbi:MHJ_0274 family protein [Mycoplasma sp. 'Moose RK']|uniref:MHJ_0274 family protein n=1 Tax=Mycoplasma sp. 'Moose RK' TaxID=2780095 RepID=UPI0018C2FBFD|nr:hypothetical protein [Mycoplasma sp. 'Moose RK']MBG0730720.1 hypothetical protein [Mycoplasma sp. 'Moose RK']